MTPESIRKHHWEMDSLRTRLEIGVLVYRCRFCGCLQIKNGGPDAPSVFKPTHAGWNPFRTLPEEPSCQVQVGAAVPNYGYVPASLVAGRVNTASVHATA